MNKPRMSLAQDKRHTERKVPEGNHIRRGWDRIEGRSRREPAQEETHKEPSVVERWA